MDTKFLPAVAAIRAGDLDGLKAALSQDATLATARSSCSHPTLLQCLALDAVHVPNKVEMANILIDAGADINGALSACASINNVELAQALLDAGASINGTGGWSPLEEALYWRNEGIVELLVRREASVHNLRIAAGLGRTDLIEGFFNGDGSLKSEAGRLDWPFGDPITSNSAKPIEAESQTTGGSRSAQSQDLVNNAFIYACINNRIEAARLLLQKGAEINAVPPGFDYAGTGLHNAAVQGHKEMVEFLLEQGADATIKDQKVNSPPAGWAAHGGHVELKDYLEQTAIAQSKANG